MKNVTKIATQSRLLPREKASLLGLNNLLDHELLALLLIQGSKDYPANKLTQTILKKHPLGSWKSLTAQTLKDIAGCGESKSWQILASVELGKRIFTAPVSPVIRSAVQVKEQVAHLTSKQREEVVCLYLNARQELIEKQTVAIGGLNYTNLHPRDVFGPALKLPCSSLILVHNHPSGNTEPSSQDLEVTTTLQAVGKLIGISLLDHIIIGGNDFFSFVENGLIR